MVSEEWKLNQQNLIGFVMVDSTGTEVPGLAGLLSGVISKNTGAGAAMLGTFAETAGMNGWYTYLSTAGEADTVGIIKIEVVAAGAVQQNLEYVVEQRNPGAIPFTYTLTSSVTALPIEGAVVWITTDIGGANIIWSGVTDAFGVPRDSAGGLPYLDPGTYYFFRQHGQFTFTNPDIEIVSNP